MQENRKKRWNVQKNNFHEKNIKSCLKAFDKKEPKTGPGQAYGNFTGSFKKSDDLILLKLF